ncbi:MAG TPA: galactitol-1-phosphate 5-dehydrogenase [Gammaproteobacteria bacterium]|nr:galactitol-1-phosphate 5-dehydrogenase [Gammaproteobacteria bacterium]
MIDKMSAVVYTAPNEVTFVKDYQSTQQDRDDDVLLRIESVGICGSDMHAYHGKDPRRKPGVILGHEFCGEIVGGKNSGKIVTGNPLITCGVCSYCLQGRDNLCSDRDMIGMNRQGAFAQYMNIPEKCLVEAPKDMDPNHVALTEPAATVVHAVDIAIKESYMPIKDCHVLVIGAGAIGLLTSLLLKSYGVKMQILETNLARHQCVKEHVGVSATNPITQSVKNEEFDVIIDCVGSEKTSSLSFEAIKTGGVIVNVGLQSWTSSVNIRKLTLQEIKLVGCYTYNMEDFKSALKLIRSGDFGNLSWVKEYPLSEASFAFNELHNDRMSSAKVVLRPHY